MDTIVKEKQYIFKELEQIIFRVSCQTGVRVTQELLKKKDQEICLRAGRISWKQSQR